jgi:hypothetical protein
MGGYGTKKKSMPPAAKRSFAPSTFSQKSNKNMLSIKDQ